MGGAAGSTAAPTMSGPSVDAGWSLPADAQATVANAVQATNPRVAGRKNRLCRRRRRSLIVRIFIPCERLLGRTITARAASDPYN